MVTSPLLDDSLINRAAPPASMRYFSVLYAPQEKRAAVMALYVVDAEIVSRPRAPIMTLRTHGCSGGAQRSIG